MPGHSMSHKPGPPHCQKLQILLNPIRLQVMLLLRERSIGCQWELLVIDEDILEPLSLHCWKLLTFIRLSGKR